MFYYKQFSIYIILLFFFYFLKIIIIFFVFEYSKFYIFDVDDVIWENVYENISRI
jgi:hypothetical protein